MTGFPPFGARDDLHRTSDREFKHHCSTVEWIRRSIGAAPDIEDCPPWFIHSINRAAEELMSRKTCL